MGSHYLLIKWLHISCVILSGAVFAVRGLLMLLNSPLANDKRIARLSYGVDTVLLTAAILLTLILHQYPLAQAWLSVKVALLILYIFLGVFALRRGKTRTHRTVYWVAAMAVYAFIISVAVTHDPRGVFGL